MSSAEDSEPDEQLPEIHDIMLWSKNDMSDWLSKRGLPKSGRRKEVLAQRIYRHMTGEGSSSESESDGEDQAAGQDTLVRPKEDEWVDLSQHQQIPNIREEDITNYYLHGKKPRNRWPQELATLLEEVSQVQFGIKVSGDHSDIHRPSWWSHIH